MIGETLTVPQTSSATPLRLASMVNDWLAISMLNDVSKGQLRA